MLSELFPFIPHNSVYTHSHDDVGWQFKTKQFTTLKSIMLFFLLLYTVLPPHENYKSLCARASFEAAKSERKRFSSSNLTSEKPKSSLGCFISHNKMNCFWFCCLTFFSCCGRGLNWINFAAAWSTVKYLRTWQKGRDIIWRPAAAAITSSRDPRAGGNKQKRRRVEIKMLWMSIWNANYHRSTTNLNSQCSAASLGRGQYRAVNVTF